jgi:hypothetical protein
LHFTLKLWHGRDKNKNLAQFDKEWKFRRPKKSKAQEIALTSIPKKSVALNKPLEPQLDQSLRLYLAKSFNDDGFALVLIVAPQPGLFGFELRSFQEFFAAVHLARSSSLTGVLR